MPIAPRGMGHHRVDRNNEIELSHPATQFVQIGRADVDRLDLIGPAEARSEYGAPRRRRTGLLHLVHWPSIIRPDGQTISTTLCGQHLPCLPIGDMSQPDCMHRNIRFMSPLK